MDARLGMEKVIGRLMDSEEGLASKCPWLVLVRHRGRVPTFSHPAGFWLPHHVSQPCNTVKRLDLLTLFSVAEIVAPPELPHPRVNKALIALVAKKLVAKNMTKGKTIYGWVGQ